MISNAGVATNYEPWAIWVQGENFTSTMKAQLTDQGNSWSSQPINFTSNGWLSLQVPSDNLPSGCNTNGQSCQITVTLVDQNGTSSNAYPVTMPAAASAASYSCGGGTICNGTPVTGSPGQQVCGTDLQFYNCTSTGWQSTGVQCACH